MDMVLNENNINYNDGSNWQNVIICFEIFDFETGAFCKLALEQASPL
jgi:hypothetical protein